jgi:hypothetical protein
MKLRVHVPVLALTAAAALVQMSGPTSAAPMATAALSVPGQVLIGSDLTATPTIPLFDPTTTTQEVAPTAATLPLTAPNDGVIVEINVKHGSVTIDSTFGFSLLTGSHTGYTARTNPLLEPYNFVTGTPDGIRSITFDDAQGDARGVPVDAGERLAFRTITGEQTPSISTDEGVDGGIRNFVLANHVSGTNSYVQISPRELLIQMVIEPDADDDTYGDITQDCAPGDPTLHGVVCIAFNAPPATPSPGDTHIVSATGIGPNPVIYTLDPATTNNACRIEPTKGFRPGDPITITFLSVGDCVIRATQAGGDTATQTIRVKRKQQLTNRISKITQATVGSTYRLIETSSSGLPVAYSVDPSTTNNACTIVGTTVHFNAPGQCVIAVGQAGNNDYHPVTRTHAITVR